MSTFDLEASNKNLKSMAYTTCTPDKSDTGYNFIRLTFKKKKLQSYMYTTTFYM